MKATGIVRRIDDLGRVVIPKEIRRTMRIREGDPLEIYTGAGGEVVFKKYSPVGELSEISGEMAEAVAAATRLGVVICDRDYAVSAVGANKNDLVDRPLSMALSDLLERRQSYIAEGGEPVPLFDGSDIFTLAAYPIIASGDLCGGVLLIPSKERGQATESELIAAAMAADFLGRQLQD